MKKNLFIVIVAFIAVFYIIPACTNGEKEPAQKSEQFQTQVVHPEWSKNLSIYEVNIRQFSEEGTFSEVEQHLPRLKELGTDILWLMPIYPIGEKNRKGSLGSYYSISNYLKVNPEFGTIEDLKSLVNSAHEQEMYVLLDWVANHTAWDNALATDHPEWYEHGSKGNFVSPYDWTDVIQLDYFNEGLRDYMIDAMKYWVTEVDVDGYRCDYPGQVPVEFWNKARKELDQIKPVFMLAEDEDHRNLLEDAFDINYSWEFFHLMNQVAKGEQVVTELDSSLLKEEAVYPKEVYRLRFITNHDENSWNGTIEERLGDAAKAFAVLTFTVPGMPLIYSGQEIGLNKRLQFFEKDPIEWKESELENFYSTLTNLKKENPALWNGSFGGEYIKMNNTNNNVFSFIRVKDDHKVIVILNLTGVEQAVDVFTGAHTGTYREIFMDENHDIPQKISMHLSPWKYLVFEK